MKLLKFDKHVVTDGGITVTVKMVTKEMARGILQRSRISSIEEEMHLIDFVLCNCIESFTIDGVEYDPIEVHERANVGDADSVSELQTICAIATGAVFMSEDDEKKSD
jgi:hypothetical protein